MSAGRESNPDQPSQGFNWPFVLTYLGIAAFWIGVANYFFG